MGRLLLAGIVVLGAACARDPEPARRPSFPGVERLFPAPGSTGACTDTALRLVLDSPARIGSTGRIRVVDQDSRSVDAIDLAAPSFVDLIDGRPFKTLRPVFADGREVTIRLHSGVLAPGRRYFVSVERGALLDGAGRPLPAIEGRAWSFTTRGRAPADPSRLRVAQDGSADFCSIQGAIDAVRTPATISIAPGTYREIVLLAGKRGLTLRGDDRRRTRIEWTNNDALQDGFGSKFRALFGIENARDIVIENLTIHNQTAQGGSQAEALRVTNGDRVILRGADLLSLQDTLQLSGRVYVEDCRIEGNVDFVWGEGTAYFERCELETVGRAGYTVQARNTSGAGFVFVESRLTADPGLSGHWLARVEADRFPKSHVAYLDCRMGPHVDPRGWLVTPEHASRAELRFQEFHSMDLDGKPLDVRGRDPAGRQLGADEAAALRDKLRLFSGWNPEES